MRPFIIIKKHFISNLLIALIVSLTGVFSLVYSGGGVESKSASAPIYSGNKAANSVALMFNVTEGGEDISNILKALNETETNATFFVSGIWVLKNSNILKQIYESGNEIGNLGFYSSDMKNLSEKETEAEILNCHNLVKELLGIEMTLFAPPNGSFSKTTTLIATKLNYKTIMWSKDATGNKNNDAATIISRATKSIKAGDLILLHPTSATKNALKSIISEIKNKDLNLGFISSML